MDSRLTKEGEVIRRRRACEGCDWRFTTYERIEEFTPYVIKRDGNRVPFDRQKVVQGMKRACEKRKVSAAVIEEAVDELEKTLQEEGRREVATTWIGEWVMQRLRAIDEVAYVRFASVYRSFRDIDEFMSELRGLLDSRPRTPGLLDEAGIPSAPAASDRPASRPNRAAPPTDRER
jgi:transcriptional repressor NrdR